MHKIIPCFLLLLFAAAVFGEKTFNQENFKQLVLSSSKKIVSLNAASCTDIESDINNKCHLNFVAPTCKEAQDYVDCAVDYVKSDCGCDAIDAFCNTVDQLINQANLPCTITCDANNICDATGNKNCKLDNSCNSASSLFIFNSIGTLLLSYIVF